jgi:hypothetical protein
MISYLLGRSIGAIVYLWEFVFRPV